MRIMAANVNAGATDQLQCLQDGFDALRLEYHRLWARCQVLEENVESVKSQVRAFHHHCINPSRTPASRDEQP